MDRAIEDTLAFWFGDQPLGDGPEVDRSARWFSKSEAQDAEIRRRFGAQVSAALAGELDAWAQTPQGRLALVVTLDQFTRNIHRHTPAAFAGDARALAHALEALDRGEDLGLRLIERVFLYMPLEHAEDMAMQHRCVACFRELEQAAPARDQAKFRGFTDYAERHREVIRRFGRFPHRNAILGRENTPEEAAYLSQPGAGF